MTSLRQIEANRLNAQRSTGPRTVRGKLNSRKNALRHGLAAETIIGPEEFDSFEAFRSAVFSEVAPQTALEEILAARLVSLLWRLRRAELIETGLLRIQREILDEQASGTVDGSAPTPNGFNGSECPIPRSLVRYQTLNGHNKSRSEWNRRSNYPANGDDAAEIARLFLRLANLDHGIFERLSAYEGRLWKHTLQTINALSAIRRIPHARAI